MATFIISIRLYYAGCNDFSRLETAMAAENFILHKTVPFTQSEFIYYGNMPMPRINEAVNRAALSVGKQFTFSVMNDVSTENQHHTAISSIYRRQSA